MTYIVASTKDPASFQSTKLSKTLRQECGLDIDEKTAELEKVKIIISFVHNLFSHDGYSKPSSLDPLTILKEAKSGKSFRCVEYSLLSTAILSAFGIPARVIGMKANEEVDPEAAGGHVIIEFFDDSTQKWVASDPQWGMIAGEDKNLLSVDNLKQSLLNGSVLNVIPVGTNSVDPSEYYNWLAPYLYFSEEFRQDKLI